MKYCINPECRQRSNSDQVQECQSCGNSLVINNSDRTTNENDHCYRIIKSLKYNPNVCTEIFEVEDLEPNNNEKIKILKAIHDNDVTYNNDKLFTLLTRLFEREQNFLYYNDNDNEGIPKGYDIFSFTLTNSKKIHCLVMEKIVGENLEEWLKRNRPIDEKGALKWLKQIVEILDTVHEKRFFHRDIKPSNIMWRKSDNKLVLIDFGAVKEINQTVTNTNEENLLTTKIGTRGYVAPEQDARKAVPQSDFYALGRTFVYLLTGKQPHDMDDSSISKWHEFTKHSISPSLIKLINDLMEESPSNRPQNAQAILQRLSQIQDNPIQIENNPIQQSWLKASLIIASLVVGLSVLFLLATRRDTPVPNTDNLPTVPLTSTACNSTIRDNINISCGEETLIPQNSPSAEKKEGIDEIRESKYSDAEQSLEKAWKTNKEPETLIYLNNSKINNLVNQGKITQQQVKTIAVAVPLRNIKDDKIFQQGLEMLRGVAQAQKEAIEKGIYLQIAIANDDNDEEKAKKISEQLGKNPGILGVIGHYSSSIAIETRPIYQSNGVVLVSPSSTSVDLSGKKNFYRTSSNDAVIGKAIADHLNKANPQKVAIFWSQGGKFSESLKAKIEENLSVTYKLKNSEIFNLTSDNFNPKNALDEAKKQGATAIILIPDAGNSLARAYDVIKINTDPDLIIIGADTLHTDDTRKNVQQSVARKGFVVSVPWHPLNNKEFSESAKEVWTTGNINWLTATAYDATLVLTEAIKQNPSREGVKKVISEPDFKITGGATGEIRFKGSDRINPPVTLLKVLPNCSSISSYSFIPIDVNESCVR